MEIMYDLRELFNYDLFRQYIFSGEWTLIHVLLILMVIDIMTGLMKAWKNKDLWSRKSVYGLARKILTFIIITVANLLDFIMELDGILVLATVTFYIFSEVLSITENAGQLGLPLPKKLVEVLEVIQHNDDYRIGRTDIHIDNNDKVEIKVEEGNSNGKDKETTRE